MKKMLLTALLFSASTTVPKVVVDSSVLAGDGQANKKVVLQEYENRFYHWLTNGMLLIGKVMKQTEAGGRIMITVGKPTCGCDPEKWAKDSENSQVIQYEKLATKSAFDFRWDTQASIEIRNGENILLSARLMLSQVE